LPWGKIAEYWKAGTPESFSLPNLEQKVKSQEANFENLLHQTDLITRKIVSDVLAKAKASKDNQLLKQLGPELSKMKKQFLDEIKQKNGLEFLIDKTTAQWSNSTEEKQEILTQLKTLFSQRCFQLTLNIHSF